MFGFIRLLLLRCDHKEELQILLNVCLYIRVYTAVYWYVYYIQVVCIYPGDKCVYVGCKSGTSKAEKSEVKEKLRKDLEERALAFQYIQVRSLIFYWVHLLF